MAFHPNSELVMVEWLKGVAGMPTDKIATTLPSDNAAISASGFVTVQAIAGVPDMDTFMQNSLVQIDAWGYNENSNKMPWGKTYNLMMLIKEGTKGAARDITTPSAFNDAHVYEVRATQDPRRIPNDPAFARYSMDVIVHWTELTQ